jgi:hypothetical protein
MYVKFSGAVRVLASSRKTLKERLGGALQYLLFVPGDLPTDLDEMYQPVRERTARGLSALDGEELADTAEIIVDMSYKLAVMHATEFAEKVRPQDSPRADRQCN